MKVKPILIIVLMSALSTVFYWFQYRPSHIRSICVDEISNKPNVAEVLEVQYKMCLRKHGIEK